ncbi:MAG TPA: hypothetical protein VIU93_14685 [Gallionellaceae bacterium]
MNDGLFLTALVAALLSGVVTVTFGPASWVAPLLFLSFALCILLAWLVVFENRAFNSEPWHLLLLGPLKASATIKSSWRLHALWLFVAFLVGGFLGIAWVAHA